MFASRSRYNFWIKFSLSKVASGRKLWPFIHKAIAMSIAIAFLFNISLQAWAYNGPEAILSGSSMGGGGYSPGQSDLDIDRIDLPLSLGYIKERYKAEAEKPTIIYIQDAHCNYSCQKSIEGIIGYFSKNYGVNLAALEGGAGNYDFSIFTSIPDIDLREKIADYFVREGRVTGVELFAILNPDKLTVKGLEEPELYDKNLSVYKESISFKDKVDKCLKILKHFIDNLKTPIFSQKVKELDKKKIEYDNNKNKLKDYVLYLGEVSGSQNIKIERFGNLIKLLKLIEDEEGVNFKKAENEREALIDSLINKLSKIEIASLVEKSIDFKKGDVSATDFYEYLFRKAYSCNLTLTDYPNLSRYKDYLDKYDNVEKDVFFEEIFDVEHHIANSLFKTDDERKLFYLSDDLSVLDKLFSASLTRRLYDYYRQKEDELKARKFIQFIKEKASWYKIPTDINPEVEKLDFYKQKMGMFYQYSFERDKVFINNINKYAKDQKALFMVTGGFHTDNIIDLLKKNGYSYILITPKILTEKDNPYFHLLAGGLSPIESILSEYTAALALKSPFSEMGETEVRRYIEETTNRLREFMGTAERLRDNAVFGIPHQLAEGLFLTISSVEPESVLQEEEKGSIIDIRRAGTVRVYDEERSIYVVVHRNENLFMRFMQEKEMNIAGEIAKRAELETPIVERQAETSEEVLRRLAPPQVVSSMLRKEISDRVIVPIPGIDDDASIKGINIIIRREFQDKFGHETDVSTYMAVKDEGLMDRFVREVERQFDSMSNELIGIMREPEKPHRSPHLTIFAPNAEAAELALARIRQIWLEKTEQERLPTEFEKRIRIINTQIPYGHRMNTVSLVLFAKGEHNIQRYRAKEYGEDVDDLIRQLQEANLNLLLSMISDQPDSPSAREELYNRIIQGLEPLRLIGISERIREWRAKQEALLRSL